MAKISFGVCFAPDPPASRWVDLTKLAEANGFEYAWLFDSHVLWQEVYPIFTLMAAATTRIKIGPCVTNPGTRDPSVTASALATLNQISGGRMVMGIGRGDSARRVLGQKPVTVDEMERDCRLIRELAAGREVSYAGVKIQIKWAEHELPTRVAGYGPKALPAARRVAGGVWGGCGEAGGRGRPPGGETGAEEEPKGRKGYDLVSDGGGMAYRTRIRTPSFAHMQMMPRLARGRMIPDLFASLGAMDFVLADVDR